MESRCAKTRLPQNDFKPPTLKPQGPRRTARDQGSAVHDPQPLHVDVLFTLNQFIHISEPQNVFQKHGPRPAAREGPPAIYPPNPNKPDELLPDAQRAPEVFQVGRVQRPLQLVRGTVRCGDVGSQNLLHKLQACRCVQQPNKNHNITITMKP